MRAHLTNEDISRLLYITDKAGGVASGDEHELEEHLAACERCQAQVKMHRYALSRLSQAQVPGTTEKGLGCPDEEVWTKLAAGLLEMTEATGYSSHAAACDYCGGKLREAVQDLSAPATDDEQNLFASLRVSDPSWKAAMAEKMTAVTRHKVQSINSARRIFASKFVWAVAAAVLVVAISIPLWNTIRMSHPPERLLAEAYTEHRTLELRLGNAHHAPVQVHRGQEAESSLSRPQALIEAEAIIARGLKAHPNDVMWIQAKGRADLLAWNYEAAINSFRQALALQPNSLELMIDLSSAFFERAEATGHDLDYGAALDLLGHVLQAHPDNTTALFNRAVVLQRMRLYQQAITDWEHYLRLDPVGEWSTEARERLDDIRKKKPSMT